MLFIEKKLRLSEEKNDALRNLLVSKDEEAEKAWQQKAALTGMFESDLAQMTEKLVANVKGVRTSEDLLQMQNDLVNLQKLISVSFQALKGPSGGGT